jgi:hypothetical protein
MKWIGLPNKLKKIGGRQTENALLNDNCDRYLHKLNDDEADTENRLETTIIRLAITVLNSILKKTFSLRFNKHACKKI